MNSNGRPLLRQNDSIDVLGLSPRVANSLQRAKVKTIRDLLKRRDDGTLPEINQMGVKGLQEIEDTLAGYEISDLDVAAPVSDLDPAQDTSVFDSTIGPDPSNLVALNSVIGWQRRLIQKQINAGLLHPSAKYRIAYTDFTLDEWLNNSLQADDHQLFEAYKGILFSPLNISEELYIFIKDMDERSVRIFTERFGLSKKTLEVIGDQLGVTRERIRQISNKAKTRFLNVIMKNHNLLRIQSALLIAEDMGDTITFSEWLNLITQSGLLGRWELSTQPREAFISVLNLLKEIEPIGLPTNLRIALEAAESNRPDLSAEAVAGLSKLSKAHRRFIQRNVRFTCAVNATWLSEELGIAQARLVAILQAMNFQQVVDNWYIPQAKSRIYELSNHDVFHHAVRKMFQYCGPLNVQSICSGLRHAVSRTQFPVPPPSLMSQILSSRGYQYSENRFYWDGLLSEELSGSEAVILDCFKRFGSFVHHAELAQAFIDSEFSFPSLHMTLKRSPLFEKVDKAIYKVRGTVGTQGELERAKAVAERTPVDVQTHFDIKGNIVVSANIGILAVATGVLFSEQLPNLEGEWECSVADRACKSVVATESEFRRLGDAIQLLNCKVGERLEFTFNTWNRTVSIKKVLHNNAN